MFRGWTALHLATFAILAVVLGAGAALLSRDAGATLLGVVAGCILGWGFQKGALFYCIRGALLGAIFLTLVGPGADYVISRTAVGPNSLKAVVAGALVGGALGVKNARRRNPAPA